MVKQGSENAVSPAGGQCRYAREDAEALLKPLGDALDNLHVKTDKLLATVHRLAGSDGASGWLEERLSQIVTDLHKDLSELRDRIVSDDRAAAQAQEDLATSPESEGTVMGTIVKMQAQIGEAHLAIKNVDSKLDTLIERASWRLGSQQQEPAADDSAGVYPPETTPEGQPEYAGPEQAPDIAAPFAQAAPEPGEQVTNRMEQIERLTQQIREDIVDIRDRVGLQQSWAEQTEAQVKSLCEGFVRIENWLDRVDARAKQSAASYDELREEIKVLKHRTLSKDAGGIETSALATEIAAGADESLTSHKRSSAGFFGAAFFPDTATRDEREHPRRLDRNERRRWSFDDDEMDLLPSEWVERVSDHLSCGEPVDDINRRLHAMRGRCRVKTRFGQLAPDIHRRMLLVARDFDPDEAKAEARKAEARALFEAIRRMELSAREQARVAAATR